MAARYAPRRLAPIALAVALTVALVGCEGLSPPPPRPLNTTPELEALGQSWEEGLAKGMAVLIVAGPKIRTGDELGSFRSWKGEERYSAQNVWANEQGLHSPPFPLEFYPSSYGDENYVVMLLPAGTYGLTNVFAQLPNVQLNEKLAQKQPQDRGLGTVEFAPGAFREVTYRSTWRNATTQQKQVDHWSCVAVIAGTNQCVSHYMDRRMETQVKPGYYDREPELRSNTNALAVRIALKKPMARITLAPGEVVLTDGMVFRLPNFIGFGERACMGTEKKTVRCELNGIAGQTFRARLEVLQDRPLRMARSTYQHLMQGKGSDQARQVEMGKDSRLELVGEYTVSARMNAVLQRAVYKPLQVLANPDPGVVVVWRGQGFGYHVSPATVD